MDLLCVFEQEALHSDLEPWLFYGSVGSSVAIRQLGDMIAVATSA